MAGDNAEPMLDTHTFMELKELENKARFIVAIKTTIGRESDVANSLSSRAKRNNAEIYSLLAPERLRGYLLIEFGLNYQQIEDMLNDPQHQEDVLQELNEPRLIGQDGSVVGQVITDRLNSLLRRLKYTRGVVSGIISMDEIEHFLSPPPLVRGIEAGDIVEIIKGPFKGEKARISKKDESKEEVTVELLEAMVSIPLTIKGSHVRVIEKEAN